MERDFAWFWSSMKRPRSYGDGMDEDGGGEKGVARDWGRRDQDGDRPSPRRRFYPKVEFGGVGRKGSSSASCDRVPEIDREPPLRSSSSSSRKRFDYEPEAFDRRKGGGGTDRYRDGGDRSVQSSSPRISYFGDRIHRADSFSSSSRRDYPKGFRSERDKPRREESTSSSWRRSSGGKEASSDDGKSVATSAGAASGRGHRIASEDSGKTNSKSSSSGEQLKSAQGSRKPREARKEVSNSSEREEGELEPDVEPPQPETFQDAGKISTSAETRKTESGSKVRPELETRSSGDVKPISDLEEDAPQIMEDDLGAGLDSFNGTDGLPAPGNAPVDHPVEKDDESNDKELEKGGTSQSSLEMEKLVPAESEDRGSAPHEGEEQGSKKDPSSEGKQEDVSLPEEELENTEIAGRYREEKDVPPPEEKIEEAGTADMCCEEEGVPPPPGEKLEKKDKPEMCTEEEVVSPQEKSEKREKMGQSAEEEDAPEKKLDDKEEEERCADVAVESEIEQKAERCIDSEVRREEVKVVSPEVAAEAPLGLFDAIRVAVEGSNSAGKTLKFMAEKSDLDKGKGLAISASNDENFVDKDDAMEGPSSRGFDLFSPSNASRLEKGNSGVVIGKRRGSDPDLERLDLSLSLPGASSGHSFRDPQPRPGSPRNSQGQNPRGSSPVYHPTTWSLPSSLPSNSDGFTASASFSGSQGIFHNPSCSLTQNSKENFENSVGSHPLFKPVDQLSNGGIWQGNPSNESKHKGFAVPLYQRSEANGKSAHHHHPSLLANGRQDPKPDDYNSGGIKREIKRERSSGNLARSRQQEAERIVPNGSGVVDRVLSKIVSEPVEVVGRMLQEMTEQSIAFLKESIAGMVTNQENQAHISPLLETLRKRSDLSLESLSKVNPTLLEILVTLKTGLPGYVRRGKSIPPADLAEIFLNMRCRNLACRSLLPVDDCDCKVCSQRNGFCSACMCLVCGEFDSASNTCGWVGCDVCLHWCHTNCALRHSYIRNGRSVAEGGQGGREMQFICVACGHPSEMFGFVKEVFKTCARSWGPEVLAKELEYIRKIFSSSEDPRGVRLHAIADQQLLKLEKKADCGEVVHHVLTFLYGEFSCFYYGAE